MPLVGGGGSPNVAGSNPSGTGTSVNFLRYSEKTLVYGYSGALTVTGGSDVVGLKFTTGNEAIDGKVMVQYMGDAADGDDSIFKVRMDSQRVIGALVGTNHGGANPALGPENWIPIIIPPFTNVEMAFRMLSGGGSIDLGVTLIGEAYA